MSWWGQGLRSGTCQDIIKDQEGERGERAKGGDGVIVLLRKRENTKRMGPAPGLLLPGTE